MCEDNYSIDYKSIIAMMKKKIDDEVQVQRDYIELGAKVGSGCSAMNAAVQQLHLMPMGDQVKLLKALVPVFDICANLCEQYGIEY